MEREIDLLCVAFLASVKAAASSALGSEAATGSGAVLGSASWGSVLTGSGAAEGAGAAGVVSVGLVVDDEGGSVVVGLGSSFLAFFLPNKPLMDFFIVENASSASKEIIVRDVYH